jgi:hypothetical protein
MDKKYEKFSIGFVLLILVLFIFFNFLPDKYLNFILYAIPLLLAFFFFIMSIRAENLFTFLFLFPVVLFGLFVFFKIYWGMNDTIFVIGILVFMAFGLIFFLVLFYQILVSEKKAKVIDKKLNQLTKIYKEQKVFLCIGLDEIESNLVQLSGLSLNTSLISGMKMNIDGNDYTIKEVYGPDNFSDKPDDEVLSNQPAAVIIEKGNLNVKSLLERIKRESVIVFYLK